MSLQEGPNAIISVPFSLDPSDIHDGHVSSRSQYGLISQAIAQAGREWRNELPGTFYIAEISIKFLRPILPDEAGVRVDLHLRGDTAGNVSRMCGQLASGTRVFTKFSLTATWR